MRYRTLGATGLVVSEIGFGAWGIGGKTPGATSYGPTSDDASRDALRRAFDCGITFYDTANVYGDGHSETLLGEVFRTRRDRVIVATKAGRPVYAERPDYSGAELRRSLEGSLRRLGTDYVDLYQLHDPPPAVLRDGDTLATLDRLRAEGKVRAVGVSVRSPDDGLAVVRDHGILAVHVNLNLIDQRARENGLLALAAERGAGLIARTPLCFGLLSGRVAPDALFDPSDHRSAWPRPQIARWAEASRLFIAAVAARERQTPAQLALRFCLSFPGVSTVIPGMLTAAEVEENAAAADLGPLGADDLAEIARVYGAHTFFLGAAADSSIRHTKGGEAPCHSG
jgi:aryl-alcohol dehydrogenase-like predicted oxidoreductase